MTASALIVLVGLLCSGCVPRCTVQTVDWTDYDACGHVIGHRPVQFTVCR